jgi:hypothetical protein
MQEQPCLFFWEGGAVLVIAAFPLDVSTQLGNRDPDAASRTDRSQDVNNNENAV